MKHAFPFLTILCVSPLLLATPATAQKSPITIQFDTKANGIPVSPYLYGIFFEEINHAGDGGLYAELVQNRSFEEGDNGILGWSFPTNGQNQTQFVQDSNLPLNSQNPHSLRVNIPQNTGEVTLINAGYWGIPLQKNQTYNFSLYARGTGKLPLEIRLQNKTGKVVARTSLATPTGEWKQYKATLRATDTVSEGSLVIATKGTGTLNLDMVSLFPKDTYKRHPNGTRSDLSATVAAMKPGFMRFPGGCFVEGDTMASAFRWKNTLGDTSTRLARACLWGYLSSEGLGFHEYLQFCEDIHAAPLLVVNCGMSHHGNVPLSELQPWIDDALDAIEYANGATTTQWGALRAKQGHPKPFGLKFIEVGNENGGAAYEERFARFVDAIRKRYPDLKIIADVWGGTPKSRAFDLVDEHYYSNPDFFFQNAHRYDTYSRTGAKIYVGEYAVTDGAGTGNLHAALSEAAFMIGMERNADVVSMASYAPLFVRAEDRKWNPDAIVFNSAEVYGTPSYHVQRLFGTNRPSVTLPTTVKLTPEAGVETSQRPPLHGAVGLGTWSTQAEYKDILVTSPEGKSLTTSDLKERIVQGIWEHKGDLLAQVDSGTDKRIVLGNTDWTDYTLSLKARKVVGAEGFLILFRVRDDNNLYWWNIGGWGNTRHAVERMSNGGKSIAGNEVAGSIQTDRWYDVRVEVRGAQVKCFLDNQLIHSFEEKGIPLFHATAGKRGAEYIVKVVNGSPTPQTADIVLAGRRSGSTDATIDATILAGDALSDENSFANKTKIAPKSRRLSLPLTGSGDATTFSYTFLPHSVTILRFK